MTSLDADTTAANTTKHGTRDAERGHANERDARARVVPENFITEILERDLKSGRTRRVVTRFPPEPNGYLHIGHAKSILLNFGLARDYGGACALRFDDTNPETEDLEYVEAIRRDIRWLGFDWNDRLYFASDYFPRLYEHAVTLIERGDAYVDSSDEATIREERGTITQPGRASRYRTRAPAESLDLLERMKAGEFPEGAHVLRAKIDMASPNMVMRDPILYRIRHKHHYRTGNEWAIYPLYDFAHGLSDAIEGVTHSLCTLEFEVRRELYDWFVERLYDEPRPRQYEFGRHVIEYTVTGKRKLIQLVKERHVDGWDDPRLPTLAGLRRRGVTPAAIREFVRRIGISRQNSTASIALLEHAIRDDLNWLAPRVMAVLEPLKVVLTNAPAAGETLEASYWPHDVPQEGTRPVPFGREVWIERSDFAEDPPKGFKRLSPGALVRLRHAYVIRCDDVVKDERGEITEVRCSVLPDTLGANPDGEKVQGAIHWVAVDGALPAEFRLYDRLFRVPDPDAGEGSFTDHLNPESLRVVRGFVEPSVAGAAAETRYQFERQGYFWRDADSREDALVFNRIVTLRDSWAKAQEDARSPRAQRGTSERDDEPRLDRPAAAESTPARDLAAELAPAARERYRRYTEELGLQPDDAVLVASGDDLAAFFEDAVRAHDEPQAVANWIVNELVRELKGRTLAELGVTPERFAALVALVTKGVVTARIAKELLPDVLAGRDPEALVRERGLERIGDSATLEPIVRRVLAAHPGEVEAYRGGKTAVAGFFVGQVMRASGGKADPKLVGELVRRALQ